MRGQLKEVASRSQVKDVSQGAGLTFAPNAVDEAREMKPEN